jgi:hypothetical protein
MAYSSYSSDLDDQVYRIISLCGTDDAAIAFLGVTYSTYRNWIKRHETFREAIESAKEFHRKIAPDALRIGLLGYIEKVVREGGETIITREVKRTRTVQRDGRNRIIMAIEVEEETETRVKKGIPSWIANKVVANVPTLNDALAKVLNSGLEVLEETEESEQPKLKGN